MPAPARLSHRLVTLSLALPVVGTGPLACDDPDGLEDMEMRSLEARAEREPAPEPDPEPAPEPIDAEELVGLTLEEAESMLAWTVVYEMDRLLSATLPYSAAPLGNIGRGWHAHALQWKEYVTRSFVSNVLGSSVYAFDVNAADAAMAMNGAFSWGVDTLSAGNINLLEAGPS